MTFFYTVKHQKFTDITQISGSPEKVILPIFRQVLIAYDSSYHV